MERGWAAGWPGVCVCGERGVGGGTKTGEEKKPGGKKQKQTRHGTPRGKSSIILIASGRGGARERETHKERTKTTTDRGKGWRGGEKGGGG